MACLAMVLACDHPSACFPSFLWPAGVLRQTALVGDLLRPIVATGEYVDAPGSDLC